MVFARLAREEGSPHRLCVYTCFEPTKAIAIYSNVLSFLCHSSSTNNKVKHLILFLFDFSTTRNIHNYYFIFFDFSSLFSAHTPIAIFYFFCWITTELFASHQIYIYISFVGPPPKCLHPSDIYILDYFFFDHSPCKRQFRGKIDTFIIIFYYLISFILSIIPSQNQIATINSISRVGQLHLDPTHHE